MYIELNCYFRNVLSNEKLILYTLFLLLFLKCIMITNYNLHVQVCVLPLFTHNPSSLGLPSVWLPTTMVTAFQASGGSTLLNLDFFGPVDDSSSSSSTTIPGQQSVQTTILVDSLKA